MIYSFNDKIALIDILHLLPIYLNNVAHWMCYTNSTFFKIDKQKNDISFHIRKNKTSNSLNNFLLMLFSNTYCNQNKENLYCSTIIETNVNQGYLIAEEMNYYISNEFMLQFAKSLLKHKDININDIYIISEKDAEKIFFLKKDFPQDLIDRLALYIITRQQKYYIGYSYLIVSGFRKYLYDNYLNLDEWDI